MNEESVAAIDSMFNGDLGWRNSSRKRLQRLLGKARTWQSALAQLADELENEYALTWEVSERSKQSSKQLKRVKAEQSLVANNVD